VVKPITLQLLRHFELQAHDDLEPRSQEEEVLQTPTQRRERGQMKRGAGKRRSREPVRTKRLQQ